MSRYGLFAVGAILLVLGGIAFLINDRSIRPIGIGAILLSTYLVRMSTIRGRSAQGAGAVAVKATERSSRLLWVVSLALLPVAIIAFLYLENDAAHGYHQVLPVYVFAGVAVLCAAVWSSLVSKIL